MSPEPSCQAKIEVIQSEKKRLAGKCAMVDKALKDAGQLQNDYLQKYSKAMRGVEAARRDIEKATGDMNVQLLKLDTAKKEYERAEVSELSKEVQKKLKNAQKERDATIATIAKVLVYAKLIRSGNIVAIADAAINKIATDIVKVDYEPKLKAFKSELAALKKRSTELDKEIADGKVASASAALEAQLTGLKNKQKDLNDAMVLAVEMRKLAMDALDDTKTSTPAMRGLADIMEARDNYVKYVDLAKRTVANYKSKLEKMKRDLSALARIYGSVDGFLKTAAKKNNSFSPNTDYGKAIIKFAAGNALLLHNWQNHATNEISYCKGQEKFLNDDKSKKGPYAEINAIRTRMNTTRYDRQKTLRKQGLKCPA
jgi:exonuclease VII small subunit